MRREPSGSRGEAEASPHTCRGTNRACFAWGFGGQYVMIFHDLALTVVATSSTSVSDDRWDYRRQFFDLLEQHVLLAAASGSAARE